MTPEPQDPKRRRPGGRRLLAAASAALWLLAASGCNQPGGGPPGVVETHLRFVADDPQTILSRTELVSETRSLAWPALGAGDCAVIGMATGTPAPAPLQGVDGRLRSDGQLLWLDLDAAIDAEAVDRLDVTLKSLVPDNNRTGSLRLAWPGEDDRYTTERMLWLGHGEVVGDDIRRYRFGVGAHPAWRGRISRLRLVLRPPPGSKQVALCALEGFHEELTPERLEELATSGLKAAIDGQIRNALPAVPGRPVERRTTLPAAAELRFFYGLQAGGTAAVEFRVLAGIEGDPPEVLFRATVNPGEEAGRWLEGRVDLAHLGGRPVRLSLEATAAGTLDLERGLPLWGNPEVVAP